MTKRFYDPPDVYSPTRVYSHGVRSGRVLTLAGQAPLDEAGRPVSPDPEAQCRRVFADLQKTLSLAGATFEDVVYVRVYLTTTTFWPTLWSVTTEAFGNNHPAITAIVVPGVRAQGALIEAELIVHMDGD